MKLRHFGSNYAGSLAVRGDVSIRLLAWFQPFFCPDRCASWKRGAHIARLACGLLLVATCTWAQPPQLETVFPAGASLGQTVEVILTGSGVEEVTTLRCNASEVQVERVEAKRFRVTIPSSLLPGLYEFRAISPRGVSGPRTFAIGNRKEQLETEPNELSMPQSVPLDSITNGRIEKAGDIDTFQFSASQGQRVVIACLAERIDSRLRAVLELFDSTGRRWAVNRGYDGVDPLIDFRVPEDGQYIVKLQDLTFSGGPDFLYRLEVDTGPRVAFALPNVIQRNTPTRVTLFGWNLHRDAQPASTVALAGSQLEQSAAAAALPGFDQLEVEIPATQASATRSLPLLLRPAQAVLDGFAYHLPGSHGSLFLGLTDVPVVRESFDPTTPLTAQSIPCPVEISGQLSRGNERDWYRFEARRGEVLYFHALAERLNSPLDLRLSLFDSEGQRELAQFNDDWAGQASAFGTAHLDPAGRWVAPADGTYLLAVQNLIGSFQADPRRVYRLSIRREEPTCQVLALQPGDPRGSISLQRGGQVALELIAIRQRGCDSPIRVTADNVPSGLLCPDVWLGAGVDRGIMILAADPLAEPITTDLQLRAEFAENSSQPVQIISTVRGGTPQPWLRLTSELPVTIQGDSPVQVVAQADEPLQHQLYGELPVRHSPGGAVDVTLELLLRESAVTAPSKWSAIGLPPSIQNQTLLLNQDAKQGVLSFYLPPHLPLGKYTFALRGEMTIQHVTKQKPETSLVYSNPLTIDVQPAAFLVEVDPFAVRSAKRGETIQIAYTSQRRNGFIGKMHTEIAMPGRITDVVGLRGRGETFVGQTEKGSLQITVNDDAPLGRQPYLRLLTIGVVEDVPIYQGSSFFSLEIVE